MSNYRPAIIGSLLLILFLISGIWLVTSYVDKERNRDLFKWQDRLAILAESQKRAIEDWLDEQISNLEELAQNPLVQISLTMSLQEGELSEAQLGQVGHLRNLVIATARRAEVFEQTESISSNQRDSSQDGIGIFDANNKPSISTRGFPVHDKYIEAAIALARKSASTRVYGIYRNENREPRLIIAVPVKPIQAEIGKTAHAGYVVAVINPKHSLYQMTSQHWLTTTTDETVLLSGDHARTVYLSPLAGEYQLFHEAPRSNEQLAANFVRNRTGDFGRLHDYRGEEVLATGRTIDRTDWLLLQKIDVSEALSESRSHQEFVLTVFLLALFVITISFIAIWRHATSVRLQKTSAVLAAKTALLNAVGDNIRDYIFLLGPDENIQFINKKLSNGVGIPFEEIVGRSMHHIFSIETTERLLSVKNMSSGGDIKNKVMRLMIAENDSIYHVSSVTLAKGDYKDSVLFVLHDIAELKQAQDRHNRLLEGIIATLVYATDMHDPHCAHHSQRTREVAVAIARAMNLDEDSIETLSMAALLANIGKLYLPREILTKLDPLTAEEEELLQGHVKHSVEIIKDLEFDGPVVEIIEQKNERPDGKGYPVGLRGDNILQEAKIIAAANAFVAMSSARAYRQGLPVKDVLDAMLSQADHAYDRSVIAALFHVAENRSDWKNWQQVDVPND